jgi:hypothetical protein
MAKAHRTTHRSSSGKKLYAARDAKGRFKDIWYALPVIANAPACSGNRPEDATR